MDFAELEELGGDKTNQQHVFGQYQLNHTVWKGQSFVWLMTHVLSYCGYFANELMETKEVEKPNDSISFAKFRLLEYVNSFIEGRKMRAIKAQEKFRKQMPDRVAASSSASVTSTSQAPKTEMPSALDLGVDTVLQPLSATDEQDVADLFAAAASIQTDPKGTSLTGTYSDYMSCLFMLAEPVMNDMFHVSWDVNVPCANSLKVHIGDGAA